MRIEIDLPNIEAISLNHYNKPSTRGRFVTYYKPKESQVFDSKVNSCLKSYKSEFSKLNKSYDETKHYLIVDYVFYMPIFVKKKDRISKKSKDVDNIIKPVNDLLFNFLNCDDSSIISVSSTKVHSDTPSIKIKLQMCNINNIL
jgi:Holliday junction resolvase RusA-like endonuclease